MRKTKILYTLAIFLAAALAIIGCGDQPPDLPSPVPNTGIISIYSEISFSEDSTFEPEMMKVFIDGDDYGYVTNPCTIEDVPAGVHQTRVWIEYEDRIVKSDLTDVEAAFGETSAASISIRVGSIAIAGEIEMAPDSIVAPDSIGVIIDGDSLGYFNNPDTIGVIPEGEHSLSTFTTYDGKEYLGQAKTVQVAFNNISDARFALTAGGVILLSINWEQASVEEFSVDLDFTRMDTGPNPRTITNVEAGVHDLKVSAVKDTFDLEGWAKNIEVALAETSYVEIDVVHVCPCEGFHAPDIVAEDLDGNLRRLSDHWGEVIYLYFFEHT